VVCYAVPTRYTTAHTVPASAGGKVETVWTAKLVTYLHAQEETQPGTSDSAVTGALNIVTKGRFPQSNKVVRTESAKHVTAIFRGMAAALSADMREPLVSDVDAEDKSAACDGAHKIAMTASATKRESQNPTDMLEFADVVSDR
jgi:hypothetical protein